MKNNKGFTLIELLAVILILGIIALIAIPTVSSVVEQSRNGAKESTGTELVKAAEQWIMRAELDGNLLPTDNSCAATNHKCTLSEVTDSSNELALLIGIASESDMAKRFDVKGDLPKYSDITLFTTDGNGNVQLRFTQDNVTCTNVGSEKGNVKCSSNNG